MNLKFVVDSKHCRKKKETKKLVQTNHTHKKTFLQITDNHEFRFDSMIILYL